MGAKTAYIEPGSPWENDYIESFNARLRDELLNGEIFYSLKEAQVIIESCRRHYSGVTIMVCDRIHHLDISHRHQKPGEAQADAALTSAFGHSMGADQPTYVISMDK